MTRRSFYRMKWLGSAPRIKKGISWGYPWKQGELEKNQVEKYQSLDESPIQTKIMAVWPDGSIKWTGHAAVLDHSTELVLSKEREFDGDEIATNKYNGIYINNNRLTAYFPKHGEGKSLLEWVKINNEIKLADFQVIIKVDGETIPALIDKVEIEENGAIKTVVKVTSLIQRNKEIMYQFETRFQFFANLNTIDITHTVIIGTSNNIEGLALNYKTNIVGESWNRHVRVGGDDGVYSEPAQLLLSRRHAIKNSLYSQQVRGEIVEISEENDEMLTHAKENAIWNNYKVSQLSSSHYEIKKQTDENHTFIKLGSGKRSKGMIYAGGRNGGTALVLNDFWEKYPASLRVDGLNEAATTITAWLWSPESEPIDFTHYSKRDHMLSAYEGMEEIRSTPIGIANTSRLTVALYDESPTSEDLWNMTLDTIDAPLIVMAPERYYETKVFGVWSLPNKENKTKKFLEKQMEELFNFYYKEVEQRDWYGFWNYGDVMHTYDPYRHMWRYDLGGYAWQNTELVPNMWLWQYFLRTGKEEVFRLAEAMTRHTSEVDVYHLGEYKGLGSRHNVLHWGCQCKEARISMAGLHRYYYYLTGDSRTKDLLEEVKDNEGVFERLEPLREFYSSNETTVPIRVGPDWAALVSNWFTYYELTGEKKYLDQIMVGIDSIYHTPMKLLSGPTYHFDPKTKQLHYFGTGNVGGYHMVISFGAPQVWLELAENIKNDGWNEMLAEFGRFYALSDKEKLIESGGDLNDKHFAWPMFATGMMAYAANYYKDEDLAKKIWDILLDPDKSGIPVPVLETLNEVKTWKNIREMPWISTNVVSQWCLNLMLCLELIGEYLPTINFMEEEHE